MEKIKQKFIKCRKFMVLLYNYKNSIDFITGDGGFDFSKILMNKKTFINLIFVRLYMQLPCVEYVYFKIFDMFTQELLTYYIFYHL